MVKAEEYRIGNLVYWQNSKTGLFENALPIKSGSEIDKEHLYRPISLTEEWLIRFGFKKGIRGWFKTFGNNQKFNLYMYSENTYKYVHQLQNLYFVLIGEELTLQ